MVRKGTEDLHCWPGRGGMGDVLSDAKKAEESRLVRSDFRKGLKDQGEDCKGSCKGHHHHRCPDPEILANISGLSTTLRAWLG